MINTKFKYLISHRGNISGPNLNTENTREAIEFAICMGYSCEIDVWKKDSNFYLGHDCPMSKIDVQFFLDHYNSLWIHCKNVEALYYLSDIKLLNCFFHSQDDCTLTSKGYLWTYPGKFLTSKSICVLPEWENGTGDISIACGICSDYIERYANELR